MTEVQIRPLDLATWPGKVTPAAKRRYPQFRSTWGQTLKLLKTELAHLDAKDVVIEAGFRSVDLRLDGWPRSDARAPEFPGVVVSFGSSVGDLRYATDVFTGKGEMPAWQANVRAIALGLEALRAVDRYGITKRGEQYQGWAALPPAALALGRGMDLQEAAEILGVDLEERYSADYVSERFRRLARENDPNQGGDDETFRRIIQARDLLLENLR